jgi:hypothetical protein
MNTIVSILRVKVLPIGTKRRLSDIRQTYNQNKVRRYLQSLQPKQVPPILAKPISKAGSADICQTYKLANKAALSYI